MSPESKLRAIKGIHTLVWAVFAGSIIAIPIHAFCENLTSLLRFPSSLSNRMRCPLTDIARRYTYDRRESFDIYLPLWLARHNKSIFGGLYAAGVVYTSWVSFRQAAG